MVRILTVVGILGLMLTLPACGGNGGAAGTAVDAPPQGPITVYTTCFPVDWLTRRIVGGNAEVVHILPVGEDPPDWTPPPETVKLSTLASVMVDP